MTLDVDPSRDALLVVDVQNDFCPGGALAVPEADAVVEPINRLMPRFRHIALSQDWHPPRHLSFASTHPGRRALETIDTPAGVQTLWPDHCVQGTRGAEFHPALDAAAAHVIIRKGTRPDVDSYSAFVENDQATVTGLSGWLRERGVRRVFLVGLAFDVCVLWSAEGARRLGFDAVVVEDACRALDAQGAADARGRLTQAGARLVSTADFLAAPARAP